MGRPDAPCRFSGSVPPRRPGHAVQREERAPFGNHPVTYDQNQSHCDPCGRCEYQAPGAVGNILCQELVGLPGSGESGTIAGLARHEQDDDLRARREQQLQAPSALDAAADLPAGEVVRFSQRCAAAAARVRDRGGVDRREAPAKNGVDQDRERQRRHVVPYAAMLDVPRQVVAHLAHLLAARRRDVTTHGTLGFCPVCSSRPCDPLVPGGRPRIPPGP